MQSILSEVVDARKGIAYHDLQQPSEPGELSLLEVLCAPIFTYLLKYWLLVFYDFLSHACVFGFHVLFKKHLQLHIFTRKSSDESQAWW